MSCSNTLFNIILSCCNIFLSLNSVSAAWVSTFSASSLSYETFLRHHHHNQQQQQQQLSTRRNQQHQRRQQNRIAVRIQRSSSCSTTTTRLYETKDSVVTTIRVPLGSIYNGGRDYLFTTRRNLRSYEWGENEIDALFDSITTFLEDSNNHFYDNELELGTISILPKELTNQEKERFGPSTLYDVHDGQQRLISLCLFLAALRDNFLEWSIKNDENDDEIDYYKVAIQIANYIYPNNELYPPAVQRIQVREKNSKYFNYIISRKIPKKRQLLQRDKEEEQEEEEEEQQQQQFQFVLPKINSRKTLTQSENCVLDAYEYFMKQLNELGPKKSLRIYKHFLANVYVLIFMPSTTRIARNFVMGLTKGKNLEPIDEFKGMVCFNYIIDEYKQDIILDKWNILCERVGRSIVQSVCIIIAQNYLQCGIKENYEVDIMEDYLKQYTEEQNNNSNSNSNNNNNQEQQCDGVYIFEKIIEPHTEVWNDFHNEQMTLISSSRSTTGKRSSTTSRYRRHSRKKVNNRNNNSSGSSIDPSLKFLLAAVKPKSSTYKEIELIILYFLRLWKLASDDDEKIKIEYYLKKAERIALWMMITTPKKKDRRQRCFDIITWHQQNDNNINNNNNNNAHSNINNNNNPFDLTDEEKQLIYTKLNETSFTGTRTKIAKAVLERLNEFLSLRSNQARVLPIDGTLQLEHILPKEYSKVDGWMKIWGRKNDDGNDNNSNNNNNSNSKAATTWMHRIGNLALLNMKTNSKISNHPFDIKRNKLKDSPYPLTKQVAKQNIWDLQAIEQNHNYILSLSKEVWDL